MGATWFQAVGPTTCGVSVAAVAPCHAGPRAVESARRCHAGSSDLSGEWVSGRVRGRNEPVGSFQMRSASRHEALAC